MRLDYYNYIELTELDLQDEPWSLGFDAYDVIDIFSIRRGEARPYDFFDDVQLSITYELDRDLRVTKRNVYIFMDWLGDIGGLAGSLYALFGAAVAIFQYKIVYSYIGNNTFLIPNGEDKGRTSSVKPNDDKEINEKSRGTHPDNPEYKKIPISFCGSIKLSLQRLLFSCKCCMSRRDKLAHMADHSVKNELQVVEWIKFKRITEAAILEMISPEKLAQLQRDYEYKVLKIKEEDETPEGDNERFNTTNAHEALQKQDQNMENAVVSFSSERDNLGLAQNNEEQKQERESRKEAVFLPPINQELDDA